MNKEYETYGPEWVKEIMQLDKQFIVEMYRTKAKSYEAMKENDEKRRARNREMGKQAGRPMRSLTEAGSGKLSVRLEDYRLQQRTISDLMNERDKLHGVARLAKALREDWDDDDNVTLHERIDYLIVKAENALVETSDTAIGLLEEAAGTFGEIGTDEPVNGGDTVDWLNDWIPRVRKLLSGS